jgi:hypothetical protein
LWITRQATYILKFPHVIICLSRGLPPFRKSAKHPADGSSPTLSSATRPRRPVLSFVAVSGRWDLSLPLTFYNWGISEGTVRSSEQIVRRSGTGRTDLELEICVDMNHDNL